MEHKKNDHPVETFTRQVIELVREECAHREKIFRAQHAEEVRKLQEENKALKAQKEELERTAQADELLLEVAEEIIHVTPRELEVLKCLRKGQQNKEIAYELGISESTVKVHIRNLMKQFNASNRTEVAMKGVRCRVSPRPRRRKQIVKGI